LKISNSKCQIPKVRRWCLAFGILFFVTWVSSAQFAIVDNPKGFAEVFESASSAKIVSKLPNGAILYCFDDEEKAGLISVDFKDGALDLSGDVKKGDIKMVFNFSPVPYNYSNENKIILARDNIRIIATQTNYSKEHSVFTFADDNPTALLKIDGKEFFGTDGEIPTRQYGFIAVTIGADKIDFPKSALEGLFQPNLEDTEAFYDAKNDILYIKSMNSDGAGGYDVLWVVEKRHYKTRYVFHGF
jgi:hypothetical protein